MLVRYDMLFFKHKTADEMRSSDWSSDVCSSDLGGCTGPHCGVEGDRLRRVEIAAGGQWRGDAGSTPAVDRQRVVSGKSVSVRVDLGGRRIIKINLYTNNSRHLHATTSPLTHHVTTSAV